MTTQSPTPPSLTWRLRLRPWLGKTRPKEREWLFFSFLIILSAGYAAFALVAWGLDFHAGWMVNGLGILGMGVLGALRWRGFRLGPLITALQTLTLAQAFAVTWSIFQSRYEPEGLCRGELLPSDSIGLKWEV